MLLNLIYFNIRLENINDLVKNLNEFRKTIKGDFEQKVETLNETTSYN